MNPRELVLLGPYRPPSQSSLVLSNEDITCILNGCSALWHPAAVRGAVKPPRIESQYDHEQPRPGYLYALPESPPLFLPEDWDQRVRDAAAIVFRATTDREATLANLRDALRAHPGEAEHAALIDLPAEKTAPFF